MQTQTLQYSDHLAWQRSGNRYLLTAVAAAFMAGVARAEPEFLPDATAACVAEVSSSSVAAEGYAVLECVGRSAQECMSTPGGDTTIGMIACLGAELQYWDDRLNAAYAERMADARQSDAEMTSIRATTIALESTLREMQRTWIAFRDAVCQYEHAQWLGGSGAGPATMACHLHETARQTLKLEGRWSQ